jgi:hypothetical protein
MELDRERVRNARCVQMVQCLRAGLLYSEKRARDFFFAAVEQTLAECRPMPLIRLGRCAADRARRDAESAGFQFENWVIAGRAVVNAMLRAGVFLSERGDAVMPAVTAQATPIAALQPDYVDRTEAYLLRYLIQELGDIGERDHKALAHALFRHFDRGVPMDAWEERVVILLATLERCVAVDRSGRYSMCLTLPAEGAAPAPLK